MKAYDKRTVAYDIQNSKYGLILAFEHGYGVEYSLK